MATQYDEKGKIFTQVVTKHPVLVTIQTIQDQIHGVVHVRPDMRIKDALNLMTNREDFLAVTDAVIFHHPAETQHSTSFLLVNVTHIIWIMPDDEQQH